MTFGSISEQKVISVVPIVIGFVYLQYVEGDFHTLLKEKYSCRSIQERAEKVDLLCSDVDISHVQYLI